MSSVCNVTNCAEPRGLSLIGTAYRLCITHETDRVRARINSGKYTVSLFVKIADDNIASVHLPDGLRIDTESNLILSPFADLSSVKLAMKSRINGLVYQSFYTPLKPDDVKNIWLSIKFKRTKNKTIAIRKQVTSEVITATDTFS